MPRTSIGLRDAPIGSFPHCMFGVHGLLVTDLADRRLVPARPAPLACRGLAGRVHLPVIPTSIDLLFGRFQALAHLWTGWGRATSFDLKAMLQFFGLPTVAPAARAGQGNGPPASTPTQASSAVSTKGAVVRTSDLRPALAVSLSVVFLLSVLATAFLWMNRRGRKTDSLAGSTGKGQAAHCS